MSDRPNNFLFIFSDQHNKDFVGRKNPVFQTPNLDALAARGTAFDRAYTNCPICVPERASLATGRFVHQIGNWDNAHPYHGENESWHHVLRKNDVDVTVIGKLHFRCAEDDNGFTEEIDTLYVYEGGDLHGCIRDERAEVRDKRNEIKGAGSGTSTYLEYDARIATQAIDWLKSRVAAQNGKPWVLWVSFVCPHPPYIAPPKWFDYYADKELPRPPQMKQEDWNGHPALKVLRHLHGQEEPFTEEQIMNMNRAYTASISNLDENIGKVLNAISELGLEDSTNIVYSTDHGESRGSRGLFGKFTMYEESAGIPFLAAGPDYPKGQVSNIPVSLVDLYPTFVKNFGIERDPEDGRPGKALPDLLAESPEQRYVFSEYHALHFHHGIFMICDGRYKYIHYHNDPPELYDLKTDPLENCDLHNHSDYSEVEKRMKTKLHEILDPALVDQEAKASQAALIEANGGIEAVLKRGHFNNSPTPGEKANFTSH
ncbi:MAG: sulfatase-like hydrolase/transferase [Verrucomicrobia bacterium]|nr:sulfatase-like hydrolase/transferase [Verrucomicrobiota bacterium]MDA1066645.1 sulfatase-like hydrolase/transferase [Verrucomicrobiota bacterium]